MQMHLRTIPGVYFSVHKVPDGWSLQHPEDSCSHGEVLYAKLTFKTLNRLQTSCINQ